MANGYYDLLGQTADQIQSLLSQSVGPGGQITNHLVSLGPAPAVAAGTSAGAGAFVAVSGTDSSGVLQIIPGAGADNQDDLIVVAFFSAFASTPQVFLTPKSASAAIVDVEPDNEQPTSFGIRAISIPGVGLAGLDLQYNYLVVGNG